MNTVGKRIRDIRKSKGITQGQLGEMLGLTQARIGQYEIGKSNPKKATLDKIAAALGVDTMVLYGFQPYTVQNSNINDLDKSESKDAVKDAVYDKIIVEYNGQKYILINDDIILQRLKLYNETIATVQ